MLLEVINLLYYVATMLYYWPLYWDPLHIAFYRVLTFVSPHQCISISLYPSHLVAVDLLAAPPPASGVLHGALHVHLL